MARVAGHGQRRRRPVNAGSSDRGKDGIGGVDNLAPAHRSDTLIELLARKLAQVDEETNLTWAERLIEIWVGEALNGNFRALQEILNRLDSDASCTKRAMGGDFAMNEETAAKILEALCDETDSFPSD